jgi:hypothetical protein
MRGRSRARLALGAGIAGQAVLVVVAAYFRGAASCGGSAATSQAKYSKRYVLCDTISPQVALQTWLWVGGQAMVSTFIYTQSAVLSIIGITVRLTTVYLKRRASRGDGGDGSAEKAAG